MKAENINPNQKESESQVRKIKAYLLSGGHITPIQALNSFGSLRLGARIHNLKNKPHFMKIKTELIRTASGKRVAEYSLIKESSE